MNDSSCFPSKPDMSLSLSCATCPRVFVGHEKKGNLIACGIRICVPRISGHIYRLQVNPGKWARWIQLAGLIEKCMNFGPFQLPRQVVPHIRVSRSEFVLGSQISRLIPRRCLLPSALKAKTAILAAYPLLFPLSSLANHLFYGVGLAVGIAVV